MFTCPFLEHFNHLANIVTAFQPQCHLLVSFFNTLFVPLSKYVEVNFINLTKLLDEVKNTP